MKVLFPFVGDSVGGSHRSSIELYKSMRANGIDVGIVMHDGNGVLSSLLDDYNIPYDVLPVKYLAGASPKLFSIAFSITRNLLRFSKYILVNKIDVVHGNDLRINLSWSLPTRLSGRKFVWHQRTLLSSSRLWKLIPYLCDCFVAISNVVYSSAPSNLSDEKKELVWNPFSSEVEYDKTEARNYLYGKYNIPTKKTLIGYVGRLVCYKKIDFFIACLYKLSDNVRGGIHLVVTGDGNDAYIRSLKQQVVEYGLQDSVTFTGFSGNPERIIAALDVLVAASTIDAFGRTLVEAMLQKTAVLASASAGHLEIVDNEVTGLLFEPSNCSDYIKKLSTLLDDENIRESYCRAGYLHAYKSYSSKVHMEKMISIYSRLMRC